MKRHVAVLSAAVLLPAAAWAGARAANGRPSGSPVLTPARVVGEVLVTGTGVVHVSPEVVQLTLSYKREGDPASTVESEAARLAAIDARRNALDRLPPRHGLGQVLRISDGTRERETVARALPAGSEAALRRVSHGGDGPVGIVIQAGKLAFHAVTVATYELLLLGQRLIPSPDTHPSRRGKARAAGPEQET